MTALRSIRTRGNVPGQGENPELDEVHLAESADALNWTPGLTSLVTGSVPTLVELPDGRMRIYYVDFGNDTAVRQQEEGPREFRLEQNYPNPFNPSTTINFTLAKASNVKLNIYNLLGQKVSVLIDRNMNAGHQSVVFDAKELSSGVYFYQLEAGRSISQKKMLLMK